MDNNQAKPRISLIIPAYNEEKYIGACLTHAVESSAGRFYEVIVVNNASVDRTHAEAEKISGVRVVDEAKKGLTQARQRGFLEARGDLLAYIDADTQMRAGWYETVLKEFAANSNLVCLSGPYIYYDTSRLQQILVRLYWYAAVPLYWAVGYMVIGGNFVIKKEILAKMGGFDTSISFYGEDTDIARRAHRFGKVKFKPNFIMPTSGRRLKGQGWLKTALIYVSNFLSEVIYHRPITKNYEDIR